MSAKKKNEITHLVCTVTGKKCFVRPEILQKRIEKYGTLENLQNSYIGRDALSLLKEGKTTEEVRSELSPKYKRDIPKAALDIITELQAERKGKTSSKIEKEESVNDTKKEVVQENRYIFKPVQLTGFCAGKITDKESIIELTKNDTCWFDTRLNDNGYCDKCHFHEHCLCTLKNLRKKK